MHSEWNTLQLEIFNATILNNKTCISNKFNKKCNFKYISDGRSLQHQK